MRGHLLISVCFLAAVASAMPAADFMHDHVVRDFPGLERFRERLEANDNAGAEKALAAFLRKWLAANDTSGMKPRGAFTESERAYIRKGAQGMLDYRFWECGQSHTFSNRVVDWHFNATPDKYREWTWQFNRHVPLKFLARHYRANGDELAAETWVDMIASWIDQAPAPPDDVDMKFVRTNDCWRSIDAGIRMDQWPLSIPVFAQSPRVSDAFLVRYFSSVWEHGHFLRWHTTSDNWLIHELEGLLKVAVLYPFLKDADEWRAFSLCRLEEELTHQVYPDGFQIELATGYHNICARKYLSLYRFLHEHGVKPPPLFRKRIASMCEVPLKLMAPDWSMPPLNDSGWGTKDGLATLMRSAAALYPERRDFLYYATKGGKGLPRTDLSLAFPYAGAVVFRSSREGDAVWAYMDCSPYGKGHQHEDKLNFLLFAYGERMITEAGVYDYDESPMRAYVQSSRAHNTALFDGKGQFLFPEWSASWSDAELTRKADTGFYTTAGRDVAESSYSGRYGYRKEGRFTHRRRAIFEKNLRGMRPFFVIVDRFEAYDGAAHEYELPWHLEDCALALSEHGFAADFGGDTGLAAFWSDKTAGVRDMKGTTGPSGNTDWQGWLPARGPKGERSCRPIPTPVVKGRFMRAFRVATVLYPYCGGACPIAGVEASSDPAKRHVVLVLKDGAHVRIEE